MLAPNLAMKFFQEPSISKNNEFQNLYGFFFDLFRNRLIGFCDLRDFFDIFGTSPGFETFLGFRRFFGDLQNSEFFVISGFLSPVFGQNPQDSDFFVFSSSGYRGIFSLGRDIQAKKTTLIYNNLFVKLFYSSILQP